ncbi:AbrB/MazE/SpoVT family DNA-binding domain-containing protein [Sphingomonas sp. MMS24-JH45]
MMQSSVSIAPPTPCSIARSLVDHLATMYIRCVYTEVTVSKEYRARTFKSGNSVALRLPKGLGVKEGIEMTVREEHGHYIAAPIDAPKRKIKGDWIGSMPWLKPLTPEDRELDERALDWTGANLARDDG